MAVPLVAVTHQVLDLQALVNELAEQRHRRWRDHAVHRTGPRSQSGSPRRVPRVRGLRSARRPGPHAHRRRSATGVAGHARRRPPSDRTAGDWRSEHHHRRRLAASRPCVCRLPIHDRAGQADRADLEARALCRRGRLARGRHGRSGRRGRAAGGVSNRMRVTIRLFARLQGPGRLRRAGPGRPAPGDRPNSMEGARRPRCPRSASTSGRCRWRSTRTIRG